MSKTWAAVVQAGYKSAIPNAQMSLVVRCDATRNDSCRFGDRCLTVQSRP